MNNLTRSTTPPDRPHTPADAKRNIVHQSRAVPIGSPMTILIADPRKSAANRLAKMLNTAGHRTRIHGNAMSLMGDEALQSASVVFVYLYLSGVNAFEALKLWRDRNMIPHFIAVVPAAECSAVLRSGLLKLGASGILEEPFSSEELYEVLAISAGGSGENQGQ
jgi:DNA-binding NtrC family response regulator